MAFVEFAKAGDIPAGTLKDYKVQGVEIAVANIGGAYYAIGRKCTHFGGEASAISKSQIAPQDQLVP